MRDMDSGEPKSDQIKLIQISLDKGLEVMKAAGIEDGGIYRLTILRDRIIEGACSDITEEHKKLLFIRYLIANRRLTEDINEP